MKRHIFFIALVMACLIALFSPPAAIPVFAILALLSLVTAKPSSQIQTTLSVNELLMDVLDAFKTEIPMLLNGFTTDFSSKTAVKNDVITAHIATLPAVQDYDATTGFKANAATADSLLTDVPVTLDTFKHVPIKVTYLTQLASKMPLYKEAIRNYGYVLAKKVTDDALAKITAANFSHVETVSNANVVLETLETLRGDLNTQKAANRGRFGIVNTGFAAGLQNDDRVKSSLFYGMLNGDKGYRTFTNLAGFPNIWEYPDFPSNAQNLSAFFADRRAIVIANRRVDFASMASELGIPQIINFYPISDPETGLEMTGVGWQDPGTGDLYVSCAVLYGIAAGSQGGAADAICDRAGVRVKTQ